ncbi:hypothetical protein Aperf_G00000075908 [Anoplocephala perfoliata]
MTDAGFQSLSRELPTELLYPAEYHFTLNQVIQRIYKDVAPAGNTQTRNLISFGSNCANSGRQQPQFFSFFAAVMEMGEMTSVVLKRPPQKFSVPELMNPAIDSCTIEVKSNQRVLHKCEVTLIDETCGHFPMILWNEDRIMYALRFWKPKATVLSIVNCPVRYDSFRRGVVAVPNDRTGIITSPACEEAAKLAQYAKYSGWSPITAASDRSDTMGQHFSQLLPLTFGRVPPEVEQVSLSGIHTVRTIEDVLNGKVNTGFGIVFAMLTKLPLDSDNVIRLVRLSCSNCHRRMYPCAKDHDGGSASEISLFACITPDCPLSGQRFDSLDLQHVIANLTHVDIMSLLAVLYRSIKPTSCGQPGMIYSARFILKYLLSDLLDMISPEKCAGFAGIKATVEYNVFLNLSDHTGTYTRCTFTNSAAETIFGMPATDFLQLPVQQRTHLKWKLLLKRFKIYFWMRQPGFDQPNPYLNVLACDRPNPFEVYSSLGAVSGQ